MPPFFQAAPKHYVIQIAKPGGNCFENRTSHLLWGPDALWLPRKCKHQRRWAGNWESVLGAWNTWRELQMDISQTNSRHTLVSFTPSASQWGTMHHIGRKKSWSNTICSMYSSIVIMIFHIKNNWHHFMEKVGLLTEPGRAYIQQGTEMFVADHHQIVAVVWFL